MAGFPKAECLYLTKNDTQIPNLYISKYGASMAKESAQKGNFYVSQLNSHRITLNSAGHLEKFSAKGFGY